VPKRTKAQKKSSAGTRRNYVSQSDIPSKTLRDALRVAQAITDNYAGQGTAPHDVALALEMSPTSSAWRDLSAASLGYGLTKGSWNADKIALDALGKRATAPTEEGDDQRARAEAALRPKVLGGFFRKYNKAKFPADHIAKNVLQQEFGVPPERADSTLQTVKDNGQYVGFIRQTKTGPFVAIDDPQPRPVRITEPPVDQVLVDEKDDEESAEGSSSSIPSTAGLGNRTPLPTLRLDPGFRVFISHSKNMGIVEQVKDILDLYDIDFEIAVEEETAAIPVPTKIMAAMRRCQAGIVVVTADEQNKGVEGYTINMNVLIEIGAAFVLYDQGVILVWDRRLKVPSNLQGLYRLEFEGDELSFSAGTKLAKAVKSLRTPGSSGDT
jgi:hypothetical protein